MIAWIPQISRMWLYIIGVGVIATIIGLYVWVHIPTRIDVGDFDSQVQQHEAAAHELKSKGDQSLERGNDVSKKIQQVHIQRKVKKQETRKRVAIVRSAPDSELPQLYMESIGRVRSALARAKAAGLNNVNPGPDSGSDHY